MKLLVRIYVGEKYAHNCFLIIALMEYDSNRAVGVASGIFEEVWICLQNTSFLWMTRIVQCAWIVLRLD